MRFSKEEFHKIMTDYAIKERHCPAIFRIEEEEYRGHDSSHQVRTHFFYDVYREGEEPVTYEFSEDEIRGVLSVVFADYNFMGADFDYEVSEVYNNPRANIASGGPRPLTDEEMRICRHPEMYCYWERKSKFKGIRVYLNEKGQEHSGCYSKGAYYR